MIGTKRLKEIEAREKAATAGPWKANPRGGDTGLMGWDVDGPPPGIRGDFEYASDAAFSAASRQDVPDLALEVRRLVKALADIRVEKAKFDACGLRVEELDAVIAIDDIAERALDGYEVDDG